MYTLTAVPTLNTLRSRGGGPEFFIWNRRCYYTRQSLDAWLSSRIQQPQAAALAVRGAESANTAEPISRDEAAAMT